MNSDECSRRNFLPGTLIFVLHKLGAILRLAQFKSKCDPNSSEPHLQQPLALHARGRRVAMAATAQLYDDLPIDSETVGGESLTISRWRWRGSVVFSDRIREAHYFAGANCETIAEGTKCFPGDVAAERQREK